MGKELQASLFSEGFVAALSQDELNSSVRLQELADLLEEKFALDAQTALWNAQQAFKSRKAE